MSNFDPNRAVADEDTEIARILAMSDEEILAECRARGDDPDENAADMRALFERVVAFVDRKNKLVKEAQQFIDTLELIWCRMGMTEECEHDPPCVDNPYNDAYQDKIATLLDKAYQRLERRQDMTMGVIKT